MPIAKPREHPRLNVGGVEAAGASRVDVLHEAVPRRHAQATRADAPILLEDEREAARRGVGVLRDGRRQLGADDVVPAAARRQREVALSQDANAAARGFTLILKKNGRVGTRRLGLPEWSSLVADVSNRAAAGLDTSNI